MSDQNKTVTTGNSDGKIDLFLKMIKPNKLDTKEEIARFLHQCQVMRKEAENGFVKKLLGTEMSKNLLDIIDEAEPEALKRFQSMDQ